jgi:O-antigen/teichoic acid export membrane protein
MLVMYALRWVLIAQLAAKKLVILELSSRATVLAVGVAAALIGKLTAERALLILGLGNIVPTVLVVFYLRQYILLDQRFDWQLFRSLLAYSLKLAAVNLLYVLALNITIMLLRYMRPNDFSSVGLYARAVGIGSMVTMVPAAIGPLLYARWAGLKGESRARQGEMATRMNMSFGLIACIVLLIWGKSIIGLLYGAAFVQANEAMQILAPSLVLMTIYSVCDNMLAGDGKAMLTAYILAGTLCVIVGVAWLTIPTMGIRGTALAALCGNAFTAVTSLAVCSKLYGIRIHRCLLMEAGDVQFIRDSLFRRTAAQRAQEV